MSANLEVPAPAISSAFCNTLQQLPVLSVGIERPGTIGYYAYPEPDLKEGQFALQTLYSGISAGTEMTFFKGSNPYQQKIWDSSLRAFLADTATDHRIPPQKFIGYMETGRVTATRTAKVNEGDVVCLAYGHKTRHLAHENDLFVSLSPDVDPMLGIFVAQMGPICVNALAHADYFSYRTGSDAGLGSSLRGKNVAVFGAGVVGLITALLAKQEGANVLVVDRLPGRLAHARRIGLQTLNSAEVNIKRAVKHDLWANTAGDPGSDIVFECTGNTRALNDAISIARRQSYVFALGFYQGDAAGILLGEEFHHNGIRLICVQIGNTLPGWDHRNLMRDMARRLEDEAFRAGLAQLITHQVPYSAAQCAYEALSQNRRELIQPFARDPNTQDIMQVVLYPDPDLTNLLVQAQSV